MSWLGSVLKPGSRRLHGRQYTFLFLALIGYLMLLPFVERGSSMLVPFLYVGVLYTVLNVLDLPRTTFRIAMGLGVLAVAVHALVVWSGTDLLQSNALLFALFLLYFLFTVACLSVLGWRIFTERQVTGDTIRGGIAVYFLGGLAWAFLYDIMMVVDPQALRLAEATGQFSQIIYYSFVTMTTLGYGDIVPLSAVARTLAYMEAALGQIYVAVLIARLVGLNTARKQD